MCESTYGTWIFYVISLNILPSSVRMLKEMLNVIWHGNVVCTWICTLHQHCKHTPLIARIIVGYYAISLLRFLYFMCYTRTVNNKNFTRHIVSLQNPISHTSFRSYKIFGKIKIKFGSLKDNFYLNWQNPVLVNHFSDKNSYRYNRKSVKNTHFFLSKKKILPQKLWTTHTDRVALLYKTSLCPMCAYTLFV